MKRISEAISLPMAKSVQPTGVSTGNGGAGSLQTTNPDAARRWLDGKRPARVDETIRHSLTSQLGVSVNVKKEWRYPEDRPAYLVAVTAGVTALSTENIPLAIAKLESAMTPPTQEDAELMVSQLQQALSRRSSSEEASEIGLDLYVSILRRHPVDVAQAAVMELATEPRGEGKTAWFPTGPELEGVCRRYGQDRAAMIQGLRDYREPDPRKAEEDRLHDEWRALAAKATELGNKVGPGPAQDEGPRGERIRLHDEAVMTATAAKQAWIAFKG